MSVVVVGAGLAGIAAAVKLSDAGRRVLLFERTRSLGGRAGSTFDKTAGRSLDLGQHVYLYCCHRYRHLLHRLGTYEKARVQSPMHIPIIDARKYPTPGSVATLYASRLPTGLHLAPAFMRYTHLTTRERLQTARIIVKLARLNRHSLQYRRATFGTWLRTQGTTENAIASFWNVVTVAALNASVDHVSAAWGMMLFQMGLLADRRAAEVGVPQVPLSELVEPIQHIVNERGGSLHLGIGAAALDIQGGSVKGVRLTDGSYITADAVVLAVTHKQLRRLLPPKVASLPFFAEVHELQTRPIIDVHLGFSQRVAPPDFHFGVFLHSPVQWLFAHDGGRRLAVSISDPGSFAECGADQIKAEMTRELQRLLRCPEPDWAVVRRHQGATFDVGPESDHLRRPQRTPIRGLFLAGDWTETGWPATMEGAVRSGELAAGALLEESVL